jgi:hypothetical protein
MSDEHHDTRLEAAAESTIAKFLSRYLTPLLLSAVAWFGIRALEDIQSAQKAQGDEIAAVNAKLSLLDAKVDYSVLQQVQDLRRRVELLEAQNRVLRATQ